MKRFKPSTKAAQLRFNRVASARVNGWTTPPVLVYYEDQYVDDLSQSQYKDFQNAKEKGDLKKFIDTLNKVHDGDGIMETLFERHKEYMDSAQNAQYKNNYNEPGTQIRVLNTVLKPLEDEFKRTWSEPQRQELTARMTPGELKNYETALATLKYPIASGYLAAIAEKLKNEAIRSNLLSNLKPQDLSAGAREEARKANKEAAKAKKAEERAKKRIRQLEEQLAAQVEVTVVDTSAEDASSGTTVDTTLVEQTGLETEPTMDYTKIAFIVAGVGVVAAAVGYWWYSSRASNA